MPSPASIAWRRSVLAGNDEIWIVMTNSAGSIMSYWVEVPDPVASPQPWSVQQIAGPGSANVPTAAGYAPAIAFDPFPSVRGGRRAHVAAAGPNGVVYYLAYDRLGGQWYSRDVSGATGSVVGITVMPDDYVYMLTVSSGEELIGWLGGYLDSPFVQAPIPATGTTNAAPAVVAAMAVRSVNSSQIEVHVVAVQQPGANAPDTDNVLMYFWSTYAAGSSGAAGSFGPWQSNQISMPSIPGTTTVYPSWPVSIALSLNPNGEIIVTAPVEAKSGPLNKSYLYYFVASSPGSKWSPVMIQGPYAGEIELSSGGVAVDGNGTAHSLVIRSYTGPGPGGEANQPTLTDYTLAQGVLGSNPVDSPGGSYTTDPLDWNDITWQGGDYNVPGGPKLPYSLDIVPGMTVRASGEVDVAFWNFPWKTVAFFSLPLGGSQWSYDKVG